MRIQRIVISQTEYPDLHFRGGEQSGSSVILKSGERVSFDTYFGSFTYTKFRDFSRVESITFSAKFRGTGRALLCSFDGKEKKIHAETAVDGDFSLTVDLSSLPQKAFLYPVIEANSDSEFIEGEYLSDTVPDTQVSCAIAICTFKREEYLKNNLRILEKSNIDYLDAILVVDNGNTLDESISTDERVRVFQNPNYGGSAGFTRGIMEAKKGGYSHVILMDDDIVIYPEAIERITTFLSILKPECKNAHFSAAMLPTSKIYLQHEKGALWNGSRIESLNTGIDLRTREALFANLTDGPIKYGAWWCFCLPLTDTDEFGLPLPLFIKFDDVEYGSRCCKNAPIITMSGMAVAHADFDGKYNMALDYYTIRNQLIMLGVHGMQNRLGCILRLIKVSVRSLFLYRYSAMPIIRRAFDDFLKGADFIMNEDADALNRSVLSMAPKAIDLTTLPDYDPSMKESYAPSKKNPFLLFIKLLTLGGHIFPNFMLKKKTAFAPLPSAKVGDCFMQKHTVQYQVMGDTGYVFDKNSLKFFKCFFSAFGLSFKIFFTFGKAARSYRKNKERLTSWEFWNSYLGI